MEIEHSQLRHKMLENLRRDSLGAKINNLGLRSNWQQMEKVRFDFFSNNITVQFNVLSVKLTCCHNTIE